MQMNQISDLIEQASQFTLLVSDVFHFQDQSTVFIGTLISGDKVIVPSKVKIYLDQEMLVEVTLQGERMPGDRLPKNSVIVYTQESVDLEREAIKKHECRLVYAG